MAKPHLPPITAYHAPAFIHGCMNRKRRHGKRIDLQTTSLPASIVDYCKFPDHTGPTDPPIGMRKYLAHLEFLSLIRAFRVAIYKLLRYRTIDLCSGIHTALTCAISSGANEPSTMGGWLIIRGWLLSRIGDPHSRVFEIHAESVKSGTSEWAELHIGLTEYFTCKADG